MPFYEYDQNNSGGSFAVDENVCHRIYIEANSSDEADDKAEELGCYFDGGGDCPCCGDRWSRAWDSMDKDLKRWATEGYPCSVGDYYTNAEELWQVKYGDFEVATPPKWENPKYKGLSKTYAGAVRFKNLEEYAQFLANEYGWTSPDSRIFYADGAVKEIFSVKEKNRG